jgi:hypothetical protein
MSVRRSLVLVVMHAGDDKSSLQNFEKAFSLDKRHTTSLEAIREIKKRLSERAVQD